MKKYGFPLREINLLIASINPAGIYLLRVSKWNTRTMSEICSKLTIKIPERRIYNFEYISHLVLVFLLLTLKQIWKQSLRAQSISCGPCFWIGFFNSSGESFFSPILSILNHARCQQWKYQSKVKQISQRSWVSVGTFNYIIHCFKLTVAD